MTPSQARKAGWKAADNIIQNFPNKKAQGRLVNQPDVAVRAVVRRQCAELVDTAPGRLGKYIGGTTRPCRNNATVEIKQGWVCKYHARLRRICKCDLCTKWSPLHRRIMAKLRGKDLKLFDEFLMMEANQSDELGVAEAKLEGEWPGWEWMKETIRAHLVAGGKQPAALKTGGTEAVSSSEIVVLRRVRKEALAQIQHLEKLLRLQPSDKYEGAKTALNVMRVWTEREMRKLKAQHNVEVCDGGRKTSELKQDANRHSQH